MSHNWENWVSESQFARNEAIAGMRELCEVRQPDGLWDKTGNSGRHALHSALLRFTTGLERLAKLTLACNAISTNQPFKPRNQGHSLGDLLQKVSTIHCGAEPCKDYNGEVVDSILHEPAYPLVLDLLTGFAMGGRRYEFMDHLGTPTPPKSLYEEWRGIVGVLPSLEFTDEIVATANAKEDIAFALSAALGNQGLSVENLLANSSIHFPAYTNEGVNFSLFCYRLVRLVCVRLCHVADEIWQSQASLQFPYLREILAPSFHHSPQDFAEFFLLEVGDLEMYEEEWGNLLAYNADD